MFDVSPFINNVISINAFYIYNVTTVFNVVDSMRDCDRYVFRDKLCFGEREYDCYVWWEAWRPWTSDELSVSKKTIYIWNYIKLRVFLAEDMFNTRPLDWFREMIYEPLINTENSYPHVKVSRDDFIYINSYWRNYPL